MSGEDKNMPAKGSVFRSWLFVHPDLDRMDGAPGLQLSPQGGAAMVEGRESIRQAIFLLLSTQPGERVMRPEYGCELYRLIFMNNDDTTAGLAIHYIQRALLRWEPRIDILCLDAARHPDTPNMLDIKLEYRVKRTQQLESLNFSIPLYGGEVS